MSPPAEPSLDDVDLRRSPRIAGLFLASAGALALVTATLTFSLVGSAVEDRVGVEVARTARLLGSPGFPLGEESVRRVGEYIGAEVVVVDGDGRVVVSTLGPAGDAAFAAARDAGRLPELAGEARVAEAALGDAAYTVGAARAGGAAAGPGRGGVYVLYPEGLIAAQVQRVWAPVAAVALVAILLAALLGVASERSVLRARTRALLRLLASVAHELRNPLGAIRTLAQSLGRAEGPDDEPLRLIAAEAERLGLVVEGLRSVGQPVRTVRELVAPDRAVEQVAALLRHQLAHRRIDLSVDLGAPDARVEADPTQLKQVVLNLVQNAAEAMPEGGAVRLRSSGDGLDGWRLSVEDEGPGVPDAVRRRLFEPFFTTKAKGLGVGLYLSRQLVAAHGGRLELAPAEAGRGARFVVAWPLAAGAPVERVGSREA